MSVLKGGRWCAAPNCKNNSNINKELSFFRFPKDVQRAKEWTISCRREDLLNKSANYLYNNCKICSAHFEPNMFLNFLKNRLKSDAVPTIFNISNPPPHKSSKRKAPANRSSDTINKKHKKSKEVEIEIEVPTTDENEIENSNAESKLTSSISVGVQTSGLIENLLFN